MFRCVRLFCCSGIPKSTPSDYYFNPRVAAFGPRKFRPEKTQGIVSNDDFNSMRKEMIRAGGSNLKKARLLYCIMVSFVLICFAWWVIRIVLSATGTHRFSRAAVIISIIVTILINIALNRVWRLYMRKAALDIQVMFDQQNKAVYGRKGIYWGTRRTLVFIHIRIANRGVKEEDIFLDIAKSKQPTDIEY